MLQVNTQSHFTGEVKLPKATQPQVLNAGLIQADPKTKLLVILEQQSFSFQRVLNIFLLSQTLEDHDWEHDLMHSDVCGGSQSLKIACSQAQSFGPWNWFLWFFNATPFYHACQLSRLLWSNNQKPHRSSNVLETRKPESHTSHNLSLKTVQSYQFLGSLEVLVKLLLLEKWLLYKRDGNIPSWQANVEFLVITYTHQFFISLAKAS